jgi:hypothetical protein
MVSVPPLVVLPWDALVCWSALLPTQEKTRFPSSARTNNGRNDIAAITMKILREVFIAGFYLG